MSYCKVRLQVGLAFSECLPFSFVSAHLDTVE
jgi:hypothetical protein